LHEPDVRLYPNPVGNILNIELSKLNDVSLEIINISGQIIYSIASINNTKESIDVSYLSNGVYFIKLQGEKINKYMKFIKD
jgi:hypothetical protein